MLKRKMISHLQALRTMGEVYLGRPIHACPLFCFVISLTDTPPVKAESKMNFLQASTWIADGAFAGAEIAVLYNSNASTLLPDF